MAALYLFGPRTNVSAQAGAPGAYDRDAHPDYVAVLLQSGRNRIELHIDAGAAERLAAVLENAARLLRGKTNPAAPAA